MRVPLDMRLLVAVLDRCPAHAPFAEVRALLLSDQSYWELHLLASDLSWSTSRPQDKHALMAVAAWAACESGRLSTVGARRRWKAVFGNSCAAFHKEMEKLQRAKTADEWRNQK